jgi:hypothetical protein
MHAPKATGASFAPVLCILNVTKKPGKNCFDLHPRTFISKQRMQQAYRRSDLYRHQLRVAAGILHRLDGVFGREPSHSQRELSVGCGLNRTAVNAQYVFRSSSAATVHFDKKLSVFHEFPLVVQDD